MLRYNRWFVLMWGVISLTLLSLLFVLPFGEWAIAAAIGFGIPEAIGIWRKRDSMPPLTDVIRRYVPGWVTFPVIYGLIAAAGSVWFGFRHPPRMGALFAMLGWMSYHFTVRYFKPK